MIQEGGSYFDVLLYRQNLTNFSALTVLQAKAGKKKIPRVIDGKSLKRLTPLKSTTTILQKPSMRFIPSKLTGSSIRAKNKGTL